VTTARVAYECVLELLLNQIFSDDVTVYVSYACPSSRFLTIRC
jgi:hypothetical protein